MKTNRRGVCRSPRRAWRRRQRPASRQVTYASRRDQARRTYRIATQKPKRRSRAGVTDNKRQSWAFGRVKPEHIFAAVRLALHRADMGAHDHAAGVVNGERETVAKQADELAGVKPRDEFRRKRAPLGEARDVFRREVADALRPVQRFFRPRRCFGRSDTGKANVFAAGVGVGQAAKFGEPVGFIAAAAASVTFPSPTSIFALVGGKELCESS